MNDNQSAFNSSEYDRKIKQTLPYYDEFYKQVIELVKTFHNSAIKWLDIGCGTGKMGSVALENIELEQFVFCDSSAEMIRISEEQFHRPNTAFSVCNVQNLKYTNEFDVITAIQVNHYLHIEERKAALKKCYATLKENGIFITFENFSPFTGIGEKVYPVLLKQLCQFFANSYFVFYDIYFHIFITCFLLFHFQISSSNN